MQRITLENYLNAAHAGDLSAVQQYIEENKTDVKALNATDKSGNTALMLAAHNNHIPIVLALLAIPGIEVDDRVMFFTLFSNLYVQKVPIVNTAVNTVTLDVFMNAVQIDNLSIVKQYIRENKNNPDAINAVDKNDYTALCYAIREGSLSCAQALLKESSTNVFYRTKYGTTAFNIRVPLSPDPGYLNNDSIQAALYVATVKLLLNMENDEVTSDILRILVPRKSQLFVAIKKLPESDEFAALKKIVEEKDKSAIGAVFCHGKKTFNKGVMADVIARYEVLCKESNTQSVMPKSESVLNGFLSMFKQDKKTANSQSSDLLSKIEGEKSDEESDHESSHSL